MYQGNPFFEAVTSGQLLVALPVAVLAGIISFVSPCVLPLVPGYLGYIGGLQSGAQDPTGRRKDRGRLVLGVVLFVLGFTLVFVAFNTAAGVLGFWFLEWRNVITRILGVVVILMGLVFIGNFPFFQRTAKLQISPKVGLAGAPLLGVVFGLGWSPCLGPTLTAITALSLNSGSAGQGFLLGLFYCLGLGLPFLFVALGLGWMTRTIAFVKRHVRAVNLVGGTLLVVIGVLMVAGVWSDLMSRLGVVISSYGTVV
ncbi:MULTISPECIES: cytochrome c biogenesis CcdA family protein [unclassified Frondihabitans]|uniref:cytochrome c biogenesis CcdA family protein n=1 Tax=unclassified Frondihabitans TaxID=2626248 RepID=UPI0006FDF3F7|nr:MULTISPECIES: cytochrome c biogenesis protein CcdA [unclassified Frondihabitans]KQQ28193.1 cytochrome C biogenesis protein [Frondihabitans sp. Leaf304]RPE78866.1 cytochrome c-type biogenesis protein [Frondihabitans sp. PhB153]RPF09147.1 cytochrome c-type biogenesis protein [Frondihabitans sp. PhB161]